MSRDIPVSDLMTADRSGADPDRLGNQDAIKVDGLQVQTSIIGHEPTDRLQVNTLAGDDDVTVAPDAAAAIAVTVDLGADG